MLGDDGSSSSNSAFSSEVYGDEEGDVVVVDVGNGGSFVDLGDSVVFAEVDDVVDL